MNKWWLAWLERFFYLWGRSIQRRPKFWTILATLIWISLVTGVVWLIYYFGEVP